MAIKKDDTKSNDTQVNLTIDNGDFQALNKIYKEWKFKDIEGVLRFALAIMTKAKNGTVYVEDETGNKVALEPAESLRKAGEDGSSETPQR